MQKFVFPDGFLWGAATASYQVEGGIDNNDWAEEARRGNTPHCGIACNHYNRFAEDFELAKRLGHNAHRFSIEWARIEPEEGKFNDKEIEHYRTVIRTLKEKNLTPFVTLWHFTLPSWLYNKGGFEHKKSVEYFKRYCTYVVKKLGSETDFWITINEPTVYVGKSYIRKRWPPFKRSFFTANRVMNNLISAHNEAYLAIKNVRRELKVGVASNNVNLKHDWNPINIIRTHFSLWLFNRRYLNRIAKFHDFIGLNYYIHRKFGETKVHEKSDMDWNIYPKGIYEVLKPLKKYRVPIYITENGIADKTDKKRTKFIKDHLYWIHRAIREGVYVRGYFYWSLMDNYEWMRGFTERFGLIEIDFDTLERKNRPSAYEYKKIAESNSLEIN